MTPGRGATLAQLYALREIGHAVNPDSPPNFEEAHWLLRKARHPKIEPNSAVDIQARVAAGMMRGLYEASDERDESNRLAASLEVITRASDCALGPLAKKAVIEAAAYLRGVSLKIAQIKAEAEQAHDDPHEAGMLRAVDILTEPPTP